MVLLPGGSFTMGSNDDPSEKPPHRVAVKAFALGRFPVTIGEWKACVAANACSTTPKGDDALPAYNLSWTDTQQYVAWLAQTTGRNYRLPSEAEWEYAARGGTETRYWWGNQLAIGTANCKGCNEPYDARLPLKVGAFLPNPLGLYDMAGGIAQWVADCWHKDYHSAPADGSVRPGGDCHKHVLRGGSWRNEPADLRSATRDQYDAGVRYPTHGLRVARDP
jgi:formylglycine-generating enzyme required for sulfatase activity